MNREISSRNRNCFCILYRAVNIFVFAVKMAILILRGMGLDSVLEPISSGHLKNCSLASRLSLCIIHPFEDHIIYLSIDPFFRYLHFWYVAI